MSGEGECGRFLLVYGSETGQAKAIAEKIFTESGEHGLNAELHCFSETDKKFDIHKEKCIVIVLSTTGDGDPPQTVQKFWRRIRKRTLPANYLSEVNYALLALGDSNYNNFCNCGKTLDKRLEALGAKRFYPTGYGDDAVDLEECVEPWLQGLWISLKNQLRLYHKTFDIMNEEHIDINEIEKISKLKIDENASKFDNKNTVSISVTETDLSSDKQIFSNNKVTIVPNGTFLTHQEALDVLSDKTDKKAIVSSEKLDAFTYQDNNTFNDKNAKALHDLPIDEISLKLPTLPPSCLEISFNSEIPPGKKVISDNNGFFPSAASHVVPATITSAKWLTSSPDVKTCLQLTINIMDKNVNYEPGDSFGFMCQNPSEEVEELLSRLNLANYADVYCCLKYNGKSKKKNISHLPEYSTLRNLLTYHCDIRPPVLKKTFLRLLNEYTSSESDKRRLDEFSNTIPTFRPQLSLLDILTRFPSCKPPIEVILEHLPTLKPRFYSVASSPLASPDCFNIFFNIVEIKRNNTKGICTGWLSKLTNHMHTSIDGETLSVNTLVQSQQDSFPQIRIYKRINKNFYLPRDPSIPIIMVGPGTGLVPFIGFLQHREHQIRKESLKFSESWLFYGCRYKEKDFLYKKELHKFHSDGILTKLLVSFSREITDKYGYVQDNIIYHSVDIVRLIKAGATIYVCGDAKNMSQDVFKAFTSAWSLVEDCTAESATDYFRTLQEEKRYLQDVWA